MGIFKKIFFVFVLLLQLRPCFAQEQVVAKNGMVVSEQKLASEVGVSILKAGGNAVDAAVAVGYALAVVSPCCGNLGGGGFMTIHFANKKNIFINFREKAPLAAKPDMFLDKDGNPIPKLSEVGYLAVGVSGTVMGLNTVLKKYGTMTREQVMAPAIALAEKGFVLTVGDIEYLQKETTVFRSQPNVAAIFLNKNHQPFKVGDRLIQKNLANTLKLIASQGSDVFYKGKIAKTIVQASSANGGILSLRDFSNYSIQELKPITCTFNGYTIISSPPPSSGGIVLCEMLNILEKYPLKKFGLYTAKSAHYLIESMRYAFYDRNNELGDPDFVENPVERLTSKEYADQVRQRILDVKATFSDELNKNSSMNEGINTTHYSVYDKKGNAVSVTYTLNSFFGAKVIAGNTGFFLNDEMDDFALKAGESNKFGLRQGDKNTIQPGKRPLSSMTPSIILRGNKVVMVVGSPGGPRIITATLETLLDVLVYGMPIQQAVDFPRFHHQWLPDVVYIEPGMFNEATRQELVRMGYQLVPSNPWSSVEAIYVDSANKVLFGGSDRRRKAGGAVGY